MIYVENPMRSKTILPEQIPEFSKVTEQQDHYTKKQLYFDRLAMDNWK